MALIQESLPEITFVACAPMRSTAQSYRADFREGVFADKQISFAGAELLMVNSQLLTGF